MRPLKMKTTTSTDEAVLAAQQRAARKSKHRRRERPESITPPRRPPTTTSAAVPDHEWGPDESAAPPEQAYKRTRTEEEFEESLRDAAEADRGVGFYEDELYARQQRPPIPHPHQPRNAPVYSGVYGSAAAVAAGLAQPGYSAKGVLLAQMDEDEYAEHIRAGIWRMKNKEEVERRERIERERKVKEEKERVEKEQRVREERERIRKLEERRKRKSKEEEEGARKRYEEAWRKLVPPTSSSTSASAPGRPPPPPPSSNTSAAPPAADSTAYPLRFTDFPWPIYPPLALPPLSWPNVTDLTAPAISTFLLESLPDKEHKAVLRRAVLSFHPDRFDRLVARIPEEKEETRDRVRELGLRVSQVLNELLKGTK